MKTEPREARDLFIVLIVITMVAIFSVSLHFVDRLYSFLKTYVSLHFAESVINVTFLLLIGLLRLTYDKWRRAAKQHQELESIINSIGPDVMLVIGKDRTVTKCSSSVKRMFGHEMDQVTNQKTDFLYYDRRSNPKHLHEIHDILEGTGFHVGFATGKKKNGEMIPLEIITGNLSGRDGAVLLLRDITERKRLEELKDEFVGTISHELRTPLSVIKEGVTLLLDEIPGKIIDEQRDILTTVKEYIVRLAKRIDSLLDISKIELGQSELEISLVDLTEVAKKTIGDFRWLAEEKKIGLDCEFQQEEINVYCDADKIEQVLVNLLANALKFTPEGGIAKVVGEDQGDQVLLWVEDTGIGIDKQDVPKLFEKFTQFSRKPATEEKGTGLGLAIAKSIVQMHRGKIWAESEVDRGSRFYFTIPKLSSEEVFRGYLSREIRRALKDESCFSAILLKVVNYRQLLQDKPKRASQVLRGIEVVIKKALRRKGDLVLKDTGEVLTILPDTKRPDALSVIGRTEEKLREFMSLQEDLRDRITFTNRVIFYPDEATDERDLLDKLREG